MKKKQIILASLAAAAGLALVSCTPTTEDNSNRGEKKDGKQTVSTTHNYTNAPADENYTTDGGTVDVYLNYSGTSGITYRKSESFTNAVDNVTYTSGKLLPTWTAFAAKTKTTINDVASYTKKNDNDTYADVKTKGYVADNGANIDLFYNATGNINDMGKAGAAVNLEEHLDKMPNLKKFLDANDTIHKSLKTGGKMYYAPYFDGYNDVERMFMMDTSLVETVLDADNFEKFDTTINGGKNPAKNLVQSGSYTPYVDAQYNYPADTKVKVLKGTEVQEITIKKVKNIIVRQNELLNSDAGVSGQKLAEQFRVYLNEAYGDYIGSGKVFGSYSDIFCSESAAYNADELIALMRVVKANPKLIVGDADAEIETLFPRGQANNRVDNIADFMQVWGVAGMTSKKDMLYFLQDGTLNDAATTPATYDALQKLSAIYDEGLILTEFWLKGTSAGSKYLDKYFKKTTADYGYGLLMYDYCATQAQGNDIVDGIGTTPSTREKFKGEVTGIRPILPPLAYWNNGTTAKYDAALSDHAGKELVRYSEENRSLKSTAWCIPSNTDNLDGALRLMDYIYSDMGRMIQDFGPEAYWQKPNTTKGDTLASGVTFDATKSYVSTDIVAGEKAPIISNATKAMIAEASKGGTDFWSFMREYIGSTHGIGCERSKAIQVQSTNAYGQVGLINLQTAINKGVVIASRVDKVKGSNTWDTTVPTAGYASIATTVSDTYEALTTFWASDKCADAPTGWVYVVKEKAGTDLSNVQLGTGKNTGAFNYTKVQEQMTVKNKSYLYQHATAIKANGLAQECVPDYAKTTA